MASLQETLEQNLKEREKELRERAQEALVQSIEDQVTKIEQTLEDEFENVNTLLASLLSEEQQQRYLENMLSQTLNAQDILQNQKALDIQEILSSARILGIDVNDLITMPEEGSTNYNISIGGLDLNQYLSEDVIKQLIAALTEAGFTGTTSNSSNS